LFHRVMPRSPTEGRKPSKNTPDPCHFNVTA
jgi:hypothetical protein